MLEEGTPRNLPERTGRHFCIKCLTEVPAETYLANDHLCDACAEEEAEKDERDDEG